MAIKINTAYGELLKSDSLNEKMHNVIGSNAILNGFDVSLSATNTIQIKPGKAFIQGCAIEETSQTNTVKISEELLTNKRLYAKINYNHRLKTAEFLVSETQAALNELELAEIIIEDGVAVEVKNHSAISTVNSLTGVASDLEAQKIRDMIPSGFVSLGELDYDYMLNNENVVKLKSESVAYVNGYRIEIPKDTIVNIGKAPEKDAREDLLFLEAWKDEDFNRDGKLKWRIRHVADVDFSLYDNDGFSKSNDTASYNTSICPQGARLTIPTSADIIKGIPNYTGAFFRSLKHSNIQSVSGKESDNGLFIVGWNTGSLTNHNNIKNFFKTLDGYVYAIPMFKLYRKPSCGKAIPFEYQKINPKVDYSKFAELMKEERVERVVSETIEGRSLVNLIDPQSIKTLMGEKSNLDSDGFILMPKGEQIFNQSISLTNVPLKPNTQYTLIKELNKSLITSMESLGFNLTSSSSQAFLPVDQQTVNKFHDKKAGITKILLTSKEDLTNETKLLSILIASSEQDGVKFRLRLLEGDWTNKSLPEYFTGLKSLGEDEGLITVKNSILNESSYNPITGTPKLNTVSGTNYISSDNLITPNIEGQVKRGEVKVSDLTSFGKVDSMVGDEQVEFTKIKGRTLQNLAKIELGNFDPINPSITISNNIITAPAISDYNSFNLKASNLFKPSTKYTVVVNVFANTLTNRCYIATPYTNVVFDIITSSWIDSKQTGIFKFLLTTKNDITNCTISLRSFVDNVATSGEIKLSYMILEGDYTSIPQEQLPYIDGIKSVGEFENNKVTIKRFGKNLFNNVWKVGRTLSSVTGEEYAKEDNVCSDDFIKVTPSSTIISNKAFNYLEYDINKNFIYFRGVVNAETSFTLKDNTHYIKIFRSNKDYLNTSIEEGTVVTSYEPYKEYKQEITLKEPLRSLPNGVCDTIEGNKVIRRVGKVVLNGTESITVSGNTSKANTQNFSIRSVYNGATKASNLGSIFDKLPTVDSSVQLDEADYEGAKLHKDSSLFYINIAKSKLVTVDVQGMKTWLSQNPVTVYYELANPVEEIIEPNYDKESIKTYQLDAPLRSLPNGVKDEIVGNKLVRRCGETYVHNLITPSNMSVPSTQTDLDRIYCYIGFPQSKKSTSINILSDKLPCKKYSVTSNVDADSTQYEFISGYNGMDTSNWIYIKVLKTKLESLNRAGFEKWLIDNPIKVIYELATPIEIPLKEVLPSQANFSLARQFNYTDNYLLELPNGVKDTVENGKVIRRVGKYTIDSNSTLSKRNDGNGSTTMSFNCTDLVNTIKITTPIENCFITDMFGANQVSTDGFEGMGIGSNKEVFLEILRSKLDTSDLSGFKTWIAKNPITILFELATPTTEELSGNNNRYVPYHEDNTYCGSLYIGNGTNDTYTDTVIKSESVIIDTPFRSIENKEVVDDCRYKKNNDGYDRYFIHSKSKNMCPINDKNINFGNIKSGTIGTTLGNKFPNFNYDGNLRMWCNQIIPVTPNTPYTLYTKVDTISVSIQEYDDKLIDIKDSNWRSSGYTFVTTSDTRYIALYLRKQDNGAISYTESNDLFVNTIQLQEGTIITDYEPFVPMEKAFENTESNDVEDLRHQVSLTGFNYEELLNKSFDSLLRGEL